MRHQHAKTSWDAAALLHDPLIAKCANPVPPATKVQQASALPTRPAETYTAHSTAISAVKFNKVYLTPGSAVPSISSVSASDKRCSLGVIKIAHLISGSLP